jgi:hypothetical protein
MNNLKLVQALNAIGQDALMIFAENASEEIDDRALRIIERARELLQQLPDEQQREVRP